MSTDIGLALVIGATSDIGRAIARKLGRQGCALQLAARDPVRLAAEAADLRVRTSVRVTEHPCDVLDPDGGVSMIDGLDPCPDVAVCVVGLLGDQQEGAALLRRPFSPLFIGVFARRGCLFGSFCGGQA